MGSLRAVSYRAVGYSVTDTVLKTCTPIIILSFNYGPYNCEVFGEVGVYDWQNESLKHDPLYTTSS